jgi:hypothetical protein
MTQVLQLLVFVGAIAGLIAFGFYRDKKEHMSEDSTSTHFSDHHDNSGQRQGAAMSRAR